MGDIKKSVLAANVLIFSICPILTAQSNAAYYTASLYTKEQIAQMVQSGEVKNDTLIWKNGMKRWAAAKTIAEFQTLFTPAAAVPVSVPEDFKPIPAPPQSAAGPKNAPKFYAQLKGPFNAGALIEMARSGALTEDSLIWERGMGHWVPAGTIAGLEPLFRGEVGTPVKRFQLGLSLEGNDYSRNGIAVGAAVSACFFFIPALSAGMRIGYFNNIKGLSTIEAGGFLRGSISLKRCTLFAQGEGGFALFLENTAENTGTANSYFAGGKLGVLIHLNKVKLGPYIGGGFPYLLAGGILLAF